MMRNQVYKDNRMLYKRSDFNKMRTSSSNDDINNKCIMLY